MIMIRWKTLRFEDGVQMLNEETGRWEEFSRSSLKLFLDSGGSVHMNPRNYWVNGVYYND